MDNGPVFGLNIGDLLEIYDRDSQSWKMSQRSLFPDLESSSERFMKSGIMLNGKIYQQVQLGHVIDGKEFGLWPTPTKWEEKYVTSPSPQDHYHGIGWKLIHEYGKNPIPEFYEIMMGYPDQWTNIESQDSETRLSLK
jgi:hypothetical protein